MTSEKTGSEITAEAWQNFEYWKYRFEWAAANDPGLNLPVLEHFDLQMYTFIYYEQFKAVDKATAPLLARIATLEAQVEAARDRAEGYQQGVEDAMKLINTNGSQLIYVSAVNEMLSGLKRRSETTTRPSESSQPAMMSLRGIGKPLDQ